MSSETWEIIRKLRGDEIEFQIAFQCAPLITGLKESNLLKMSIQPKNIMLPLKRTDAAVPQNMFIFVKTKRKNLFKRVKNEVKNF